MGRRSTRRPHDAPPEDRTRLEESLRREFFSRAGGLAMRYGLSPDDVIDHCRRHRPTSPLSASRMVANLEDLAIAVGCLKHVGLAWSDLLEAHEISLIRALRDRLDEPDALVLVRRWFLALRQNSLGGERDRMPSLSAYSGIRPLRQWLGERLAVELARASIPMLSPFRGHRLRLTGAAIDASMSSSVGS